MSSKTMTTAKKEDATPALVPKLRFAEFRDAEGWSEVALSDVATIVMGSSPKSECYNQSEIGLPLLQGNADIKNRLSAPRIFTSEITKECTIGDILLTVRAPVGSVAKSIHHACIGRGIAAVRADQPNDQEFIYQWLLSYESRWAAVSQGGTFDAVNSDDLKGVNLTVPKPPEQRKIAEFLSSVDELMAAQARKVDALKTHKKGLMQQLFPCEGETQPRLRFREFQNVGDWEATTLGQQAKLVRGPFGGSLKKEIFVASGYAVYEQQHAIYSDFSSFRYHITAEKFYELRRFVVAAGDIIMSCSGTMGRFAIVPDGAVPGVINQALLKLTPNGFCSTKFLKEVLELPSVQEKLLSQSAGGAIKNVVSVDQIKALPLRLPGAEEQRAVVGCVSTLDDLITAETQKLDAFKTHKKGLMQQLFPSPEAVEV
jgi:type I restriction enzyme S subunit